MPLLLGLAVLSLNADLCLQTVWLSLFGLSCYGQPSLCSLPSRHLSLTVACCRAQAPDEVICSEIVTVTLTPCNHTIGVKCGEVETVQVSQQMRTEHAVAHDASWQVVERGYKQQTADRTRCSEVMVHDAGGCHQVHSHLPC